VGGRLEMKIEEFWNFDNPEQYKWWNYDRNFEQITETPYIIIKHWETPMWFQIDIVLYEMRKSLEESE
jgi:hypothetical protein